MRFTRSLSLAAAAILTFGANELVAAPSEIRDAPGGKVLLAVDGDDIRDAIGGKRLLFVDGDDIRPEPGGKRLLFVDGDDVRPEPGGQRLLFLDGNDIRKAPGGARLLFLDGEDDIRPEPGGERLYFIDGPALTKPQLVAVLYKLKPELFTAPPAAPKADANFAGTWRIDAALNLDGDSTNGTIEIRKMGNSLVANATFSDHSAARGIAIQKDDDVYVALGSPGVAGLAIYEVNGGTLAGKWEAQTKLEEAPGTGTENLKGDATLEGKYQITEAKMGDAPYTGTVTIKNVDDTSGFGAELKRVEWTMGETKYAGIGFRAEGGPLVVAFGAPEQKIAVVKLKSYGDSASGAVVTIKEKQGIFNLVK